MSTSSSRARRIAGATKAPGAGGDAAAAQARKARLEAAEVAAARVAQAAKDAEAAAKAAEEAAAVLRAEMKDDEEAKLEGERDHAEGSGNLKNRQRRESPSPPRHRRQRGHSPAVQIYREIGSGWPKLMWSNYYEWSLLMKVKLQARFLWDAIKFDDVDYE